jgi:hypothetical protein
MNGTFWRNARKVGSNAFYGASDIGEKVKRELPQEVAKNRDKLKKEKKQK